MIKKYVKKPVVVEAIEYTGDNAVEIAKWAGGEVEIFSGSLAIDTTEGTMTVSKGDFVIKGTRGEFYPCKPEPFWDTFKEV